MIDAEFCHVMSCYNRWQNKSLYREADKLTADARDADRGAFFGSIHATLAHVLWGDRIWMSRFDGWAAPTGGVAETGDWATLMSRRRSTDDEICLWTKQLNQNALEGDLVWHSPMINAEVQKPKWVLVQHFFNHQTHHRGQVHAMITAAGGVPDATDLGFIPGDVYDFYNEQS